MDWGAFAGGMSKGIGQSMDPLGLKDMMTGKQQQQPQYPNMPYPMPGQDVPFTNEMQVPYGPQQQGGGGNMGGLLKSIMTIFGGLGG